MARYLRNQGKPWNHKRIERIYRALGLQITQRKRKRYPVRQAQRLEQLAQRNQVWSLDFMSDRLTTGRNFRTLNILDDFNRQALWIQADTSLPASRVIRILESVIAWHGKPQAVRVDNGPEWLSRAFQTWAAAQGIEIHYIQPGKPAQNGYVERFNRTYRCVSIHQPTGGAGNHREVVARLQSCPATSGLTGYDAYAICRQYSLIFSHSGWY
ncbi:MAG: transposase [Methanobacteriota archaeon]|nr:MAG: transposase [Euryarchaeota archaeon]